MSKLKQCGYHRLNIGSASKTIRLTDSIKFNDDIELSVQASDVHYCLPRKTLPYYKYTRMEIALIHNNHFVDINEVVDTNEFDTYKCTTIYECVPVRLIEKLYQMLKNKYGLKK